MTTAPKGLDSYKPAEYELILRVASRPFSKLTKILDGPSHLTGQGSFGADLEISISPELLPTSP